MMNIVVATYAHDEKCNCGKDHEKAEVKKLIPFIQEGVMPRAMMGYVILTNEGYYVGTLNGKQIYKKIDGKYLKKDQVWCVGNYDRAVGMVKALGGGKVVRCWMNMEIE